uniref:Uncharacterized protein n=1 Tax=viral metagenome TaxID=1070528 RepID=A0A6H1ZDM5_9ZZZZ
MDPRLQLLLMITDRIFTLVQYAQEVSKMTEEQALQGIEKERTEKDNLVEEVTL